MTGMEPQDKTTSHPDQLEYHTPSMSPFDRPMDTFVRRADTIKRVIRYAFPVIFVMLLIAFIWFFWARFALFQTLRKN